jgi:3-hydroxyacyl-[acyl-carrier-protein] dehydratase
MGLLPHRDPMLLVDRIPWLEPGVRAVAIAADLAVRAPALPRAPGEVPPEALVEGVAQTAAALLVAEGVASGRYPPGEPQPGVLGAVPEFRFHGRVAAGEPVTFRVGVERKLGRLVLLRGEAFAGARLAAEGLVSIALGKPGA